MACLVMDIIVSSFNPCFYWMSEGTVGATVLPYIGGISFNPCFYWMSEGTEFSHRRSIAKSRVSILVFIG